MIETSEIEITFSEDERHTQARVTDHPWGHICGHGSGEAPPG